MTRAGATIATGSRAGAKRARITISAGATKYITVEIDSGSGFQTIINNFNLTAAVGQGAMPATFKMGFSSSTGASTNYHEIRDLTVGGAQPSTTTPVCAPNPSSVGQSVTCTATVTGAAGTPTGTVDFYDGATLLQAGVALNGSAQATYTTSAFALGAHTINAYYSGDGVYGVSNGSTTQQVNKLPTTTQLTASPNPSTAGQCVALTARVSPASNGAAASRAASGVLPTGTVLFYQGNRSAGQCTLVNGTCSIQQCNLAVGSHAFGAEYPGDANYLTSRSAALAQQVLMPADVPEGDTLLLLGGGMSGLGVWLRYQWSKRRAKK